MSVYKTLLKVVAIGGLLAMLNPFSALADNRITISGTVVNLRTAPSTSAAIITKASQGQSFTLLGHDGTWMKIQVKEGQEAYVSAEFATVTSADGLVTGDNVNVRTAPSTTSEIIGTVSVGTILTATGIQGDFYVVPFNGTTAYVHQDYLLSDLLSCLPVVEATAAAQPAPAATQQYVLVKSETGLNLRKSPSTDAEVLAVLPHGGTADLVAAGTEWHQVSYSGMQGYVSAEFSSIETGSKPDNSVRTELVAYAQKFLGTRYSWGGTSLTNGVDCSGFVYAVYRDFGYTLNRTSRDQIKNGRQVSKSELLPGDLVFFDTTNAVNKGYISHVGIYIGGGQFVHSSSSSRTPYVTINALSEKYYDVRYVGACRILP